MTTKETRTVTINDHSYYVVGKESDRRVTAKVYDDDSSGRMDDNLMVEKSSRKNKWFGQKRVSYPKLPELMQDALSKAVESVEQERLQKEEIDERIDNVRETYEE